MKRKQFIILVFATIVIVAVFLQVTGVAWSQDKDVPKLKQYEVEFPFPTKDSPKGTIVYTFQVDQDACIENVIRPEGAPLIMTEKQPDWLSQGKEIKYLKSPPDLQCSGAVIAVEGSPVEVWWIDPETHTMWCLYAYCTNPLWARACAPPSYPPCH